MIHVYSWDPGKMTGWAFLKVVTSNEVTEGCLINWQVGQADHFEVGNKLRNGLFSSDTTNIFVCESYKPSPAKTFAPWSLETIGLIRYWANHYDIPFKMFTPSEAKSLITDDVLRKNGLWTPGMRHANDAVIQGMYYLIKERRLLTSCLRK